MWPQKLQWFWYSSHGGCGGFDEIFDGIKGRYVEACIGFLFVGNNKHEGECIELAEFITFRRETSISSSVLSCWSSSLSSSMGVTSLSYSTIAYETEDYLPS